jgi:LEA14-like dessication related protein
MRRTSHAGLVALIAVVVAACASVKPPSMYVEGLHVGKPHVTGIPMEIRFRVQNPNPDDLEVEKVEYELILNGVRLGRGYVADGFDLPGFGQARVASRFQLSLLRVPAGVREVLEHDRVKARAKGRFYVRGSGGRQEIKFSSEAEVSLTR